MCIAIWKDKNLTISKDRLLQCFNSNPDGAGFMYVDNKQLKVQKGFFKFDDFWQAYQQHELKKCVIHFRIKTHGSISVDNCHPFEITNSLGFVHNGVISGYGEGDISDTRDFNNLILKPLVSKWGNLSLFEPAIKHLIEERIGYSKLIFLDRQGKHEIFNENKGVWDDEVWYSNSSYKPSPVVSRTIPPISSYYKYGGYVDNAPKAPALPPPTKVHANMVVKEGELVRLITAHWEKETKTLYKRGRIFEVVAVNSNYTADLMSDEDDAFAYNVPFAKLDFYDEAYDIKPRMETNSEYWERTTADFWGV